MSIDQLQAAAVLFPAEAAMEAKAAAPVARPAPTPATASPTAAAPAEESHAEKMDRLDKMFGCGKHTPGQADAEAKPASDGEVRPEIPDYLDQSHPDVGIAAPILAEAGISRDQAAKLETLHQQMTAAAIDRQAAAWAAESEVAFAKTDDVRDARAAIAKHGSPELKEILNRTGLGNHPELVRFAARAFRSNPRNYF